jgi:hypothetical protein
MTKTHDSSSREGSREPKPTTYRVSQWRRVVIHAIEQDRLPERDLLKCIRLAEVAQASDGALRGKLGWFGHRQLMTVLRVSTNTTDAFLDRLERVGLLDSKPEPRNEKAYERRLAIPPGWEAPDGFLLRQPVSQSSTPKVRHQNAFPLVDGVSVRNSPSETPKATVEVVDGVSENEPAVSQFSPDGVSVLRSTGEMPSVERTVEEAVDNNTNGLVEGTFARTSAHAHEDRPTLTNENDDDDAAYQLDAALPEELTDINLDRPGKDEGTDDDPGADDQATEPPGDAPAADALVPAAPSLDVHTDDNLRRDAEAEGEPLKDLEHDVVYQTNLLGAPGWEVDDPVRLQDGRLADVCRCEGDKTWVRLRLSGQVVRFESRSLVAYRQWG